ncbi:hypothetical protein QJS10_CPA10g01445 [Acorus calamus]|uniref:Uncharacterized protein n=1 Tax=Acorus calamus TaxID=4465 RepID=A0AAV9E090_ACOCL|nr:hypothetical protein QJS10_CPA10g01445 [Acorus calamus]
MPTRVGTLAETSGDHHSPPSPEGVATKGKILAGLLDGIRDNLYHPKRNWTIAVREHLNKTLGFEGLIMQSEASKSLSFLSHPLPECSCKTSQFSIGCRDQTI